MKTYSQEELKEILDKHRKWLYEDGGSRANLSGADLSCANLSRANLSCANLSGANLSRANLSGADLSCANLSRANLSCADLSCADLSRAYLSCADLSCADLSCANLSCANLSRANLSGADLSRANLSGADLSRANLSRANLSRAYLSGANLSRANLSRANLGGANLSGADLSCANLRDTLIENISWLAYIGITGQKEAYAYKMIRRDGEGCFYTGINYLASDTFEVPDMDTDVNIHCSKGINLATFAWCLNNKQASDNRLLLMRFDIADAICPVGSDGKFRVKKCTKVCECDWNGRPLAPAVSK